MPSRRTPTTSSAAVSAAAARTRVRVWDAGKRDSKQRRPPSPAHVSPWQPPTSPRAKTCGLRSPVAGEVGPPAPMVSCRRTFLRRLRDPWQPTSPPRPRATCARLTAEAFIYGFPLVFNLGQVDRFVREGMGAMPARRWNRFAHARALAGPQDTFVSINNDTVYSVAALDLSAGGRCASRSPTPRIATTCCSSSTPGPTTSPMSAGARPAPRRRASGSCRPGSRATCPTRPRSSTRRPWWPTIVGRWAVAGERRPARRAPAPGRDA